MEVLYLSEHRECFFYDRSLRPQIEIIRFKKGESSKAFIEVNEMVFFVEGTVRHASDNYPLSENCSGEFIFMPSGENVYFEAVDDSVMTIIRMDKPVGFCANYSMEDFYNEMPDASRREEKKPVSSLPINEPLSHFLEGISYYIDGGLRCRSFSDLKINELFLLLRFFYTKEQLRDFLRPVLSADTTFSEYVRANRSKYPTSKQMAASLNMTVKQFALKFGKVFGSTPYNWLKRKKADAICRQLLTSNDPLIRIAEDNGFNTLQQFSNFCKKELGATPSKIRATQKRCKMGDSEASQQELFCRMGQIV